MAKILLDDPNRAGASSQLDYHEPYAQRQNDLNQSLTPILTKLKYWAQDLNAMFAEVYAGGVVGSGGVQSVDITAGTGITSAGGPVTFSGSIVVGLADTAVTPGTYSNPSLTVDQQGRIIAAASGSSNPAITPAEIAAGVTPVDTSFPPGHIQRYGVNTTPGVTDMTAAWNAAVDQCAAVGGAMVIGNRTAYALLSAQIKSNVTIWLPSVNLVKLGGGPSTHLLEAMGTLGTATAMTSDIGIGEQSIGVVSATGFAAGQMVLLRDATYEYGTSGRNQELMKIANTSGNTIYFETPTIRSYGAFTGAEVVHLNPAQNFWFYGPQLTLNPGTEGGGLFLDLAYNFTLQDLKCYGPNDDPAYLTQRTGRARLIQCNSYAGQNTGSSGYGYGILLDESSHNIVVEGGYAEDIRENTISNGCRHIIVNDYVTYGCVSGDWNTHGSGNQHVVFNNPVSYYSAGPAFSTGFSTHSKGDSDVTWNNPIAWYPGTHGVSIAATPTLRNSRISVRGGAVYGPGRIAANSYGVFSGESDNVEVDDVHVDGQSHNAIAAGVYFNHCADGRVRYARIHDITNGYGVEWNGCTNLVINNNDIDRVSSYNLRNVNVDPSTNVKVFRNLTDDLLNVFIDGQDFRDGSNSFDTPPNRTAVEISLGIVPVNAYYQPSDSRRYGVSPTASASVNSTGLNNAGLVAFTNGGGFVDIQCGSFAYDQTLLLRNWVTFRGAGAGATFLNYMGSAYGVASVSPGARTYGGSLSDMTVNNTGGTGTTGVQLDSVSQGTFTRVFPNNWPCAFDIFSPTPGFAVYNRFNDCRANTCVDGYRMSGVSSNDNRFINCRVNACSGVGVQFGNCNGNSWIYGAAESSSTSNSGQGVAFQFLSGSLGNIVSGVRVEGYDGPVDGGHPLGGVGFDVKAGATENKILVPYVSSSVVTPLVDAGSRTEILFGTGDRLPHQQISAYPTTRGSAFTFERVSNGGLAGVPAFHVIDSVTSNGIPVTHQVTSNRGVGSYYRGICNAAITFDVDVTGLITGRISIPQTPAELAAGVTPTNTQYDPGDVRRYGTNTTPGTTDMTTPITRAMSVAGTHRVVFQPQIYLTGKFTLPTNANVYMPPGCVLKDKGALVVGSDRFMNIINDNIHVEAWGAKVDLNGTYSSGTNQQNHGVFIFGAQNVTVLGLLSENCGGDGFYVGGAVGDDATNVTLIKCRGNLNWRNGLSVTGAVHFRDIDGEWTNNLGTDPKSGIDIEPNAGNVIKDVRLIRPRCMWNYAHGIQVYIAPLGPTDVWDVEIIDPYTSGNGVTGGHGIALYGRDASPCRGRMVIDRPICEDENYAGIYVYNWDKAGPRVDINYPTIINPNQANNPNRYATGGIVCYRDGDTSNPGNVRIRSPVVIDDDGFLAANNLGRVFVGASANGWRDVVLTDAEGAYPWHFDNNSVVTIQNTAPPIIVLANSNTALADANFTGTIFTSSAFTANRLVTLPSITGASAGTQFEFVVESAFQLQIDPNGSSQRIVPGANDKYLFSSELGARVVLRVSAQGYWEIVSQTGTWAFQP